MIDQTESMPLLVSPFSFRAEIDLLSTQNGGRAGPLPSGKWHTILSTGESKWSARLIYEGRPEPGASFRCVIQLLDPEACRHFPVAAEFEIWELSTRGNGRVLTAAG